MPVIIISWIPLERHDGRLNADDGIGADGLGLVHHPLQRQVPRAVEDVAELLDLSAAQALEAADDSAAHSDRIGHVAEDELDRGETGVELAIQLLAVAARRKVEIAGRSSRRSGRRCRWRGTRCCRESA